MVCTEEERAARCALNRIFGFKPVVARRLVEALGSARAVFTLDEDGKRRLFGNDFHYRSQIRREAPEREAEELERLSRQGCRFLAAGEEGYPPLLAECEDAPAGLYYRGEDTPAQVFSAGGIAVVGTRDVSPYGKEWCERLVDALSELSPRPSVISGLALGVDGTAHRRALARGMGTVGVMATGIDAVYPARHGSLAEAMVHSPGCDLVTDYPPGTAPLAIHFLRRNRIIAGIARATLLVESRRRGGGMITARQAFSYGRDVFVLPGRADDPLSAGCNLLLREQVAAPLTDAASLASLLGFSPGKRHLQDRTETVAQHYRDWPDAFPVQLYCLVRTHRGITPDRLCALTGMDYPLVERTLRLLEADGFLHIDLLQRCRTVT